MKLTERAINAINQETKLRLAIALKFTEYWMGKIIDNNKDNGPLTTAAALKVIRDETGLDDSEILEEATKPKEVA